MKKITTKDDEPVNLQALDIRLSAMLFRLVGTTPLIMNRMAEKAWQELLMPSPKKNAAERASTLKHDPIVEFRSSLYRCRDEHAPTALHMPNGSFKKAIASAAGDLPGAFKATIGRLTSVPGITVHIYGVPKVYTTIVRNSGFTRTPDVRTRGIIPAWCCEIEIEHVASLVPPPTVEKLVVAAGMFIGIGDGRPEKGASSYGRWRVVSDPDDEEFARIVEEGSRKGQLAAIDTPDYFDDETREIIEWFLVERRRRTEAMGSHVTPAKKRKRDDWQEPVKATAVDVLAGAAEAAAKRNGSKRTKRGAAHA